MWRFKSLQQAQTFLVAHDTASNLRNPGRHRIKTRHYPDPAAGPLVVLNNILRKRLLIAIGTVLLLAACDAPDQTYRVVGELASDRYELAAEFTEPIIDIAVLEGERVAKGEVLFRQDDSRARAQFAEAQALLAQRQARLDELVRGPRSEQIAAAEASVEAAIQELAFGRSELARISAIHARGLASAEALDRAQLARDTARANLKLRRAQLDERRAGTTAEQLLQAQQAVKQAEAGRDRANINLQRHTISAPVDGLVDSRLFEPGERPGQQQPVIILLGGTQPYARVYVPESIRARIKSGTAGLIHVDGLDDPIDGRVRWIAVEPAFTPYFALTERDRGHLSYVAKIDIVAQRERIPDGVPVEVEFLFDAADR